MRLPSFRRVTSSGQYIPAIDGLRFIAIGLVVLMHTLRRLIDYIPNGGAAKSAIGSNPILHALEQNGGIGVQLFFAISGFILALPFASKYTKDPSTRIPLRNYFIRRLTRLEPPYILALVLFAALFVITGRYGLGEIVPRALASLTYSSWIFFPGDHPLINGVFWSLEIEVLFYIAAPFLARVYKLRTPAARAVIIAGILLFTTLNAAHDTDPEHRLRLLHGFLSFPLFRYLQYFLTGFLLATFYVKQRPLHVHSLAGRTGVAALVVALIGVIAALPLSAGWPMLALPPLIFALYYLILFVSPAKAMFSRMWIAVIGGMCYSIYLIHTFVIAFATKLTFKALTGNAAADVWIQTALLAGVVLVVSSVFFLLIEKPCMSHDWYRRFLPSRAGKKPSSLPS